MQLSGIHFHHIGECGKPNEGGDDVAKPTVSSVGQKVLHLPFEQKIEFIFNTNTNITNTNKNTNTNNTPKWGN